MGDAYEEHVERRARAMFPALYPECFYGLNQTAYGWNQAHDHQKRKCREATRATMEADRAAGLALVPREMTEKMAMEIWRRENVPLWGALPRKVRERRFKNVRDAINKVDILGAEK